MSDRDLSPFFAPKSIAVVGAGERATSSGGAIMQMLRQAGYGGRVVPVNPKGGTIFGYGSVTSIAAIDPPVDLAVIVIRPDGSPPWSAPGCQCSMTLKKWPRPLACSRAIRACARAPAVTTCPTCNFATVAALRRRRI